MKKIRWTSMAVSLVVLLVSIVLLLNITAKNPTGRRYSSAMPTTAGSPSDIGLSAERILSKDLGVPRNDDPDQRQCICNSPAYRMPSNCRTCSAFTQSVANHRRPDFMTPKYIAESKNRIEMLYTTPDLVNQIGDYAIAARALNVPLWVYVRVNTELDPEYTRIVRDTGGDVVRYFTVPGYVDPVDKWSGQVAIWALGALAILGAWEYLARRGGFSPRVRTAPTPAPKTPKPRVVPSDDPVRRASGSVDNMADFLQRSKENARRDLDKGAAEDDLRGDDA